MNTKKMRGFTLVEILTVLCIIIILVGLLSPALRMAREQANVQKTKAMISSLEVAINMYYTDFGSYPASLSDLINPPSPYNPYMDSKDYVAPDFLDPWRNAYGYSTTNLHNTGRFDLWSNGPNGTYESGGGGDDITNW